MCFISTKLSSITSLSYFLVSPPRDVSNPTRIWNLEVKARGDFWLCSVNISPMKWFSLWPPLQCAHHFYTRNIFHMYTEIRLFQLLFHFISGLVPFFFTCAHGTFCVLGSFMFKLENCINIKYLFCCFYLVKMMKLEIKGEVCSLSSTIGSVFMLEK